MIGDEIAIMYRLAICEDEEIFFKEIESICCEYLKRMNIEYTITLYDSGENFLTAFSVKQHRYDLILLDIIMGGINGMDVAKNIRETDSEVVIIFVTSSREYVFEGYDVNALHYLTKPINAESLVRLIRKAYTEKFQNNVFVFKSGDMNHRVSVQNIVSLEINGRKVEINMFDRTLLYPGKLSDLLSKLPGNCFVRCHQAYAVNIRNIRELTRFDAIAKNGKRIPISRAYLKDVQKKFLSDMQDK